MSTAETVYLAIIGGQALVILSLIGILRQIARSDERAADQANSTTSGGSSAY